MLYNILYLFFILDTPERSDVDQLSCCYALVDLEIFDNNIGTKSEPLPLQTGSAAQASSTPSQVFAVSCSVSDRWACRRLWFREGLRGLGFAALLGWHQFSH